MNLHQDKVTRTLFCGTESSLPELISLQITHHRFSQMHPTGQAKLDMIQVKLLSPSLVPPEFLATNETWVYHRLSPFRTLGLHLKVSVTSRERYYCIINTTISLLDSKAEIESILLL